MADVESRRPRIDPDSGSGIHPEAEPLLDLVDEVAPEGARRVLNVVVAAIGLLLSLPLLILIGVIVKLTSPGPVFYTQTRVGLDSRRAGTAGHRRARDLGGKPFVIYKFRTMRQDAERGTGVVWAAKDDPRVTVIGSILRQARLDELPQLLNVLLGDMNIVGPRPERPSIFRRLRTELGPRYQLRQRVRPGITGLAQISQQYDTNIDDVKRKLDFDLDYIRRASAWEDLKIMLQTAPVILFRRGGW